MKLDKNKIWIMAAVVLSGATAYSIYHGWHCKKDRFCLICQSAGGLAFVTGMVVGITVYRQTK